VNWNTWSLQVLHHTLSTAFWKVSIYFTYIHNDAGTYIHTQRCWYVHTRVVHIDTHTRIVHIDTHNCQDRSFYTLTHCVCFLLYVIVCVCFRHACASVKRVQRVSDTLSRHVCEYTNPPFISLSLSLSLSPLPPSSGRCRGRAWKWMHTSAK